MQSDHQRQLAGHVARCIGTDQLELPVLPTIAAQVLSLVNDESADATALANLVRRDQSLAANVLRVANSASYCSSAEITSLTQAVARLGFDVLAQTALAASVGQNVFRVEGQQKRVRRMWHTSLAAAAFANLLALTQPRAVEGAFLSGLLHGIGKPIVLRLSVVEAKRRKWRDVDLDAIIEDNHRAVSLVVVSRWDLPSPIAEAVAFHADPDSSPGHPLEAALTGLAASLAALLVDQEQPEIEELRSSPSLARLGIAEPQLEAIWSRREAVQQAVNAMSV